MLVCYDGWGSKACGLCVCVGHSVVSSMCRGGGELLLVGVQGISAGCKGVGGWRAGVRVAWPEHHWPFSRWRARLAFMGHAQPPQDTRHPRARTPRARTALFSGPLSGGVGPVAVRLVGGDSLSWCDSLEKGPSCSLAPNHQNSLHPPTHPFPPLAPTPIHTGPRSNHNSNRRVPRTR